MLARLRDLANCINSANTAQNNKKSFDFTMNWARADNSSIDDLKDFTKGWFIGNFMPTLFETKNIEVAIKRFSKGDFEQEHFHKFSIEISVVISGVVVMCNETWGESDIIVLQPGESTSFLAKTDAVLCVVKTPSIRNDKFLTAA